FVQVFLGGNVDVRLRVGARLQLLDLGGERHDLGLEFGDFAVLRRLRGGGEAGRAERGGKRGSEDRVTHVMGSRWRSRKVDAGDGETRGAASESTWPAVQAAPACTR